MTTFSTGDVFLPCRFHDRWPGDVCHWFWILVLAGSTKSQGEVQGFPLFVWYEPEVIA